jgi:nucleoside-diphosphate-sugar epimerase
MLTQLEDIRQESLITKKWNFRLQNSENYPEGILVTGPNSFIGVHIVEKLQESWPGPVHLIIRAQTQNEAIEKMQQAFSKWGLGRFKHGKIIMHLGDVSLNLMGLPQKEFQEVKKRTGCVIHLAMTPLYHLPYMHFKRVWLPELERMIAFCGDGIYPKSLHYASSFNANFFQTNSDFENLNRNAWQSGYAGFKWVAARAIENAMRQNLNACVYDLPLVLGTEEKGICPSHYSIWLILDIFLKTRMFFPFKFRVISVDILSQVVVFNVLKALKEDRTSFCRPMLDGFVTSGFLSRTVASILGLKEVDLATVREAFPNKLRFDFMMPPNFYELLDKINPMPAVFPKGFNMASLPSIPLVFMSNLNQILASQRNESNKNPENEKQEKPLPATKA